MSDEAPVPRPLPPASGCWTRERLELLGWMRKQSPSLADLYEAAVTMLHDPMFPGRLRLISHSVREIINRLPDTVIEATDRRKTEYVGAMDAIAAEWECAGLARDGTLPVDGLLESAEHPQPAGVRIPQKLFLRIADLVDEHLKGRTRPIATALRLFEGLAPENRRSPETLRPVVAQWRATSQWFVSHTHNSLKEPDLSDVQALETYFQRFESTLLSLTRPYFPEEERLDAILLDANR